MCGMYGCSGSITKTKRHALISALAVLNQSRGIHSTGVGILLKDGTHKIVKQARTAGDFIRQKTFIDAMKLNALTTIGHNRLATCGEIKHATSHPFRFGTTVGTHNGVVSNVNKMRTWSQKEFEIDSQYLIWALANYGHFGPAEGALTVAHFDSQDNSFILKLFRHNRPLAFGISADGKLMVYSSELTHLVTACSIAGVEMGEFFECRNYTQTTFWLDGNKIQHRSGKEVRDKLLF